MTVVIPLYTFVSLFTYRWWCRRSRTMEFLSAMAVIPVCPCSPTGNGGVGDPGLPPVGVTSMTVVIPLCPCSRTGGGGVGNQGRPPGGVPVSDPCHTCVSLLAYRWWRCQKSRTATGWSSRQ